MAQETKVQINDVMNRLRARLFNTIEQMGFNKEQCDAHKQAVKDITSDTWNSITSIVENLESGKE